MTTRLGPVEVATKAAREIEAINSALYAIADQIRASQQVADGSVILYFTQHKPPCLGCPHLDWKIWKSHPHKLVHRWQAHRIKNPLVRLKRYGKNPELRALVKEALRLEARRSRLVAPLSRLSNLVNRPLAPPK